MTLEIKSSNVDILNSINDVARSIGSSTIVSPVHKSPMGRAYTIDITGECQHMIQIAYYAGRWAKALNVDDLTLRIY